MKLGAQQRNTFLPALLVIGIIMTGCTTQPVRPDLNPAHFLHDAAFPGSTRYTVESREIIFKPDEKIKKYLNKSAGRLHESYDNSIFIANQIIQAVKGFSYSSGANTTAAQTYHNQMANCLSMTIMAYSMAQYLGFDTEFQLVDIPEYWEWREHNSLVARHINLILKPPKKYGIISFGHPIEIDFFAPGSSWRYGSRTISESTVQAMFYNNKGAEALLTGKYDAAYAYLRAALLEDPSLGMVVSNLALLYARQGKLQWAEQNYREATRRDPEDTVSAEGLAIVLQMTGKPEQADAIMARLEHERENNPYYHYVRGEQAYAAGNWREAIQAFNKAIDLRPDIDQPYFGLAKTYFKIGDKDRAKAYLQQAEHHANGEDAKKRYQSKILLLSGI